MSDIAIAYSVLLGVFIFISRYVRGVCFDWSH